MKAGENTGGPVAWTEPGSARSRIAKDAGGNGAEQASGALFEGGPPLALQRRLGLVRGRQLNVGRRAIVVVAVGWVPLVLLSALQSAVLQTDGLNSMLWEAGAHARYLVAAPLLILAEIECAQRLSVIVRHFADSGLVADGKRASFEAAIASTRRLLDSRMAEIAVFAIAYLLVAVAAFSQPFDQIPAWHKTGGLAPGYSSAGWWHVLVSLPILLVLLLGWMWRLALWTRLLWIIARLDLRLVAAHPDRAAGLGFVGHSVRGFSIVALALAAIIAGRSAHVLLSGGELPTQLVGFSGALLAAIVALFVAPLFVFTPGLMEVWRRGAFEYGVLANKVGTAFEKKWLGGDGQVLDKTALDRPDFSATTDLYSIVANVNALRFVPVDAKSVIILVAATLLPFIPVVFMALPAEQILAGLKTLLF